MPDSQAEHPLPGIRKGYSLSRAVQLGTAFVFLAVIYQAAGHAGFLNSGIALFAVPFITVLTSMALLVSRLRWPALEHWEVGIISVTLTIVWFSFVYFVVPIFTLLFISRH